MPALQEILRKLRVLGPGCLQAAHNPREEREKATTKPIGGQWRMQWAHGKNKCSSHGESQGKIHRREILEQTRRQWGIHAGKRTLKRHSEWKGIGLYRKCKFPSKARQLIRSQRVKGDEDEYVARVHAVWCITSKDNGVDLYSVGTRKPSKGTKPGGMTCSELQTSWSIKDTQVVTQHCWLLMLATFLITSQYIPSNPVSAWLLTPGWKMDSRLHFLYI